MRSTASDGYDTLESLDQRVPQQLDSVGQPAKQGREPGHGDCGNAGQERIEGHESQSDPHQVRAKEPLAEDAHDLLDGRVDAFCKEIADGQVLEETVGAFG